MTKVIVVKVIIIMMIVVMIVMITIIIMIIMITIIIIIIILVIIIIIITIIIIIIIIVVVIIIIIIVAVIMLIIMLTPTYIYSRLIFSLFITLSCTYCTSVQASNPLLRIGAVVIGVEGKLRSFKISFCNNWLLKLWFK